MDYENDKMRLTSHSSFVNIASITCMTVDRNLTVCNILIIHDILKVVSIVSREVDEVREERLRRRKEYDRLRRERN